VQDDELEDSDEEDGFGAPLRNAKELAGMKVTVNHTHYPHVWTICFSSYAPPDLF
jgi:hypothetical protein